MDWNREYRRFLASGRVSEEDRAELRAIEGNEKEIASRFSGFLTFGTGGLRGMMEAGTNRMNRNTVAQATQGLADLLLARGEGEKGVVIAHDSRLHSRDFAEVSASVLAANGVKCYLFDAMRPTPVLSFAVRALGCAAGINITASHNPKEYNGYKAYGADGAQLSPADAEQVAAYIRARDVLDGPLTCDFRQALADGRIETVGKEVDERYFAAVLAQSVSPESVKKNADMKLVYTPLHGTGRDFVPEILHRVGFPSVLCVPEQMEPDGTFPTVKFPNPEFPEVFASGIRIAEENGCELIIATDPDADRTGIMIRRTDGTFMTLTGNQTGALLLDYVISAHKTQGTMPPEPYAVKSIVSTDLASRICEANGVEMYNVLTGFKFIGEVIRQHEETGHGSFLLGFEESYGYLTGTYARDKDAVVASMLIAEMAAYWRGRGKTLYDALCALYEKYGFHLEKQVSLSLPGADGAEKIAGIMRALRENAPRQLGGSQVVSVRDYLAGTITDTRTGETAPTGMPTSDVLYYTTEAGDTLVVRPSGTEPKIKFYFLLRGRDEEEANEKFASFKKAVEALTV